jgi:hypothetical protein
MSAYKADVQYAMSIQDNHDKPVVVSLDVEYDPVVGQEAGVAVNVLDVCRRTPFRVPGIVIPCL